MDRKHSRKENFFFSLLSRVFISIAFTCYSLWTYAVSSEKSEETVLPNLPTFQKKKEKLNLNLKFYNDKIYRIAYNVFLENGDPEYAYQIAFAAVEKNPLDHEWREKLVKAALWSNHSEIALLQWKYFIDNDVAPHKYVPEALKLARQLRNFDIEASILLKLLKQNPASKSLRIAYVKSLQNQGFPIEALDLLKKIPGVENDADYLQQMIIIANGIDDPSLELNYLRDLSAIEKENIKPEMEEAELLYMKNKLPEAYQVYQSVLNRASANNLSFWTHFAEIALLAGHPGSAIQAYRHLLDIDKITQRDLSSLLTLEEQSDQQLAAYLHAQKGYELFKTLNLAKTIFALGSTLEKWKELYIFFTDLPVGQLTQLKKEPEYAVIFPDIWLHSGFLVQAYSEWEAILKRWPDHSIIESSYLWFLLDRHDIRQLHHIIKRWQYSLSEKPALWHVFASALTGIGSYKKALDIMLLRQNQVMKDPRSLLDITDLFIQNDLSKPIYYNARWLAYYELSKQLARQRKKPSLEQALNVSELLRAIAPAEIVYRYILRLVSRLFLNNEINTQILAWALEKENYTLARYIVSINQLYQLYSPPWARLTIDLEINDKMDMDRLVRESPELLPYRDIIKAAENTGNIRAAESYAFEGLAKHPKDREMHDLFQEITLPRSRKIFGGIAQEAFGEAVGPRVDLGARFFPTPSIALVPFLLNWSPHPKNTSLLATTPKEDLTLGVIARKYVDNGWWEINLADRKSLDRTYPLIFRWQHELSSKLSAEATLSYRTFAPETTPLFVAGMKNEAKLMLTYSLDSYNTFEIEGSVQQFFGQDGFHLGKGQEILAHWQSKLFLNYPDWNFNLYGEGYKYNIKSGLLSPRLSQLVPVNDNPAPTFYMPVNSVEAAVTIGFGQQYSFPLIEYGLWDPFDERYTHDWKPYAEAGISYNSVFGLGPLVNAGLSGSVLGRDVLTFFVEFAENQQQGAQKYYIIGIRYENYF